MKNSFIFFTSLFFSGLVCACGSDIQQRKMAERLYADADMQKFVCASDSCSMREFEKGLQFNKYEQMFRGKIFSVCLVEPTLSAINSYTGIFADRNGEFEFQFISYGSGVKVDANKVGIPMIIEYSVSDPDNSAYSLNQYLWNGAAFIYSRTVPLSK